MLSSFFPPDRLESYRTSPYSTASIGSAGAWSSSGITPRSQRSICESGCG